MVPSSKRFTTKMLSKSNSLFRRWMQPSRLLRFDWSVQGWVALTPLYSVQENSINHHWPSLSVTTSVHIKEEIIITVSVSLVRVVLRLEKRVMIFPSTVSLNFWLCWNITIVKLPIIPYLTTIISSWFSFEYHNCKKLMSRRPLLSKHDWAVLVISSLCVVDIHSDLTLPSTATTTTHLPCSRPYLYFAYSHSFTIINSFLCVESYFKSEYDIYNNRLFHSKLKDSISCI